MAGFLRTKNVVYVEDIVAVVVIITIIFDTLAWLGKNSSWVP